MEKRSKSDPARQDLDLDALPRNRSPFTETQRAQVVGALTEGNGDIITKIQQITRRT